MKIVFSSLVLVGRWGLAAFLMTVALTGCLSMQEADSRNGNGPGASAVNKQGAPVDVHPYVYNRPHQVPADYVYRTERIFPPPPSDSFWSQAGSSAAGGDSRQSGTAAAGNDYAAQLVAGVHGLVAQLLESGGGALEEDQRILVSSFVNLNDLYKTSAFGRVLGEQVISELQGAGREVLDVRKTPALLVHQNLGEFGLSRDMEELPYIHEAHATVVGTYSEASGELFVNARILRNSDAMVLASSSMVLVKNALLSSLLGDEAGPAVHRMSTVQMEAK